MTKDNWQTEKLFTLYTTIKGLLPLIYKELLKIEGQRTTNSVDKWENDMSNICHPSHR